METNFNEVLLKKLLQNNKTTYCIMSGNIGNHYEIDNYVVLKQFDNFEDASLYYNICLFVRKKECGWVHPREFLFYEYNTVKPNKELSSIKDVDNIQYYGLDKFKDIIKEVKKDIL